MTGRLTLHRPAQGSSAGETRHRGTRACVWQQGRLVEGLRLHWLLRGLEMGHVLPHKAAGQKQGTKYANAQWLAGHVGHLLSSITRAYQDLGQHERAESQRRGSPDWGPALQN